MSLDSIPDDVAEWLSGVNPFTGRNIKIKGPTWKRLMWENEWEIYSGESSHSFPIKSSPIKWVGGKGALASQIVDRFPKALGDLYIEPFCGGGSILIEVLNRIEVGRITIGNECQFILSDLVAPLIDMFIRIRDDAHGLISDIKTSLAELGNEKSAYYTRRDNFNSSPNPVDFMILNRQCFRGLWRVNKSGKMNVAFGNYKGPTTIDFDNINSLSDLLRKYNVKFICADYNEILDKYIVGKKESTFVYLDPPYYKTFALYNRAHEFNSNDYADKLREMSTKATIVSSNSSEFIELIDDTFEIVHFDRKERMNPKKPGAKVGEILILQT